MNKSSRNLRNSNMLLIYTSFLVFGVTRSAIGRYYFIHSILFFPIFLLHTFRCQYNHYYLHVEAVDIDVDAPYCFQFTWLGPTKLPNHNCSSLVNTPCIPPFVDTSTYKKNQSSKSSFFIKINIVKLTSLLLFRNSL